MTLRTWLVLGIALAAAGCAQVLGPRALPPAATTQEREGGTHARRTEAATAEDKGADWRGPRATVLRTFAFRALERGLVEEARRYLQEACEIDPKDAASHAALARLYLTENDARTALAFASRAAEASPDDPEVAIVLAAALAENNQADAATELLERSWKVNAGDPDFARALLAHYAATGSDALAQRLVTRILDEQPGNALGWTLAGDRFLADGDLEAATEAYRKALELDPSTSLPDSVAERVGRERRDLDPVLVAALQAEEAGDPVGAERLYRFLARSKPEHTETKAGLARVLLRQGRLDEARTVLSTLPIGARTWREHLLQAEIDLELGNWQAARGSLLVALSQRPGLRAAEILLRAIEERNASGRESAAPAGGGNASAEGE